MRQMLLAYNKLSFSQVYKLYKSLQQYCHRGNQPELSALPSEDMELTNTEDPSADHIDKDELDTVSLHQSELRSEGITCLLVLLVESGLYYCVGVRLTCIPFSKSLKLFLLVIL